MNTVRIDEERLKEFYRRGAERISSDVTHLNRLSRVMDDIRKSAEEMRVFADELDSRQRQMYATVVNRLFVRIEEMFEASTQIVEDHKNTLDDIVGLAWKIDE